MSVGKSIELSFTGKCNPMVYQGTVTSVWLMGRSSRGTVEHIFKIKWTSLLAVMELVERERAASIELMKAELKELQDEKWELDRERDRQYEPAMSV